MNTIEINEGNKLIADFMEVGMFSDKIYVVFIPEISPSTLFLTLDKLRFEVSWDWLIPVVEKCRNTNHYQVHHYYKPVEEMLCCLNLPGVWRTVVDFINWYNENKEE